MDLEHHCRGHLQCPLSEESVTGLPLLSNNFYLRFFLLATEDFYSGADLLKVECESGLI